MKAEVLNPPQHHPKSLWHAFEDAATRHSSATAVSVLGQSSDYLSHLVSAIPGDNSSPWLSWNYGQLRFAALRIASGLLDVGVQRGSKLTMFLPNGIECALVYWVIALLQLTLMPLDPKLLEPGRETMLHYYLNQLQPDTVLVSNESASDAVDKVLREISLECKNCIVIDSAPRQGWQVLGDIARDASLATLEQDPRMAQNLDLEKNGDRIAVVFFTSGTSTGQPKGCPLRVCNLLNTIANGGGVNSVDNFIVPGVYFRGPANAVTCIMFGTGKRIILMKMPWSAPNFLDAVEQCHGEAMQCPPAYIHLLAADDSLSRRKLSSLRLVGIGGDIITDALVRKAQRTFPGATIINVHGMTEGTGAIGWRGEDISIDLPRYHDIVLNGRPMPGVNARICDPDDRIVERSEPGELYLSGQSMVNHYLGHAQPEAFIEDQNGTWLKTGDRAVMLETGHICILGRIKDIIKRVGVSLSPAVIESVLTAQRGLDTAVLGMPHEMLGEVPVAVVQDIPGGTVDVEDIKRLIVASLGPESALEDVVPLSTLGYTAFPLNATGKVMKIELKEALLQVRGEGSL